MSASNRASLNGERSGFDRGTYDASATKEQRFKGLKLPRPETFKRQHENMHRRDEGPFRRIEKPHQGVESWSPESQVDFGFQTSISIELEMQRLSVAYESEYSREKELLQQRLRRADLQRLVDYERRRGEDLDKRIAELETTLKELSGDISDRSVTPEQKQTSSNSRDSEAIRFSRSPYAYSYQEPTIKGNPWTRSPFSTSVNYDDDWTKISELSERRRIQNRIAQRNYRKKLKKGLKDLERRAADRLQSLERRSTIYEPAAPRSYPIRKLEDSPYAILSKFDTIFLIDDSGSMASRSWGDNYHFQLYKIEQQPSSFGVDLDQDNFRVSSIPIKNHFQRNTPPRQRHGHENWLQNSSLKSLEGDQVNEVSIPLDDEISEESDAWGREKSAEWKAGAGRKKSWKRCPVAKVAKKTQSKRSWQELPAVLLRRPDHYSRDKPVAKKNRDTSKWRIQGKRKGRQDTPKKHSQDDLRELYSPCEGEFLHPKPHSVNIQDTRVMTVGQKGTISAGKLAPLYKILWNDLDETINIYHNLLSKGVITDNFLWALFKPGDILWNKSNWLGLTGRMKLHQVDTDSDGLHLTAQFVDWAYPSIVKFVIPPFRDTKRISSLQVYPIDFKAGPAEEYSSKTPIVSQHGKPVVSKTSPHGQEIKKREDFGPDPNTSTETKEVPDRKILAEKPKGYSKLSKSSKRRGRKGIQKALAKAEKPCASLRLAKPEKNRAPKDPEQKRIVQWRKRKLERKTDPFTECYTVWRNFSCGHHYRVICAACDESWEKGITRKCPLQERRKKGEKIPPDELYRKFPHPCVICPWNEYPALPPGQPSLESMYETIFKWKDPEDYAAFFRFLGRGTVCKFCRQGVHEFLLEDVNWLDDFGCSRDLRAPDVYDQRSWEARACCYFCLTGWS